MSIRQRRSLLVVLIATVTLLLHGCGKEDTASTSSAGFAGLGEEANGFEHAHSGQTLNLADDFPQAHAAHSDYRIEWWYLTANLVDAAGEPLGLQWTLFRQALMPPQERPAPTPWAADQLWMAHMAISQSEHHRVAERFGRSHSQATVTMPNDAQAGVIATPFHAWLDDWQLKARKDGDDDFESLTLTAYSGEGAARFGYTLELTATGPLVLHGNQGFSQKAANGQGSMYYSQPFWQINGEVTLNGETKTVSGRGWLDREWSSQLLDARQAGWDWFSIHLDDGHKLMAFQLRGGGDDSKESGAEQSADYRSGTWITPQGDATPLANDDITLTPLATSAVAGRNVPTQWRLAIPSVGIDTTIEAPHANRWMDTSVPYWEGEVVVNDRASGEALGKGYLEMTGY